MQEIDPMTHHRKPKNLIIFGGTFDPVHIGHLQIAHQVQKKFGFDRFVFLPCKMPVLKNPSVASPKQRIEMLQLALKNQPSPFIIDTSEINRETPSYMVETLTAFRERYTEGTAISLLLGVDTFLQLPQWYQWKKVLQLANLCVVNRPSTQPIGQWPSVIQKVLAQHETQQPKTLLSTSQGLIYRYNAGFFPISSTWIRHEFSDGRMPEAVLPAGLLDYIAREKLYYSDK